MMSLLGSRLAERGWNVILPDLSGTGDSFGEFGSARLAHWLEDLQAAAAFAATVAPLRVAVAVRLGGCMASHLLAGLPDLSALVGWQPVLSGKQHLNQFLRLGVVAAALTKEAPTTVAQMRARLASQGELEIAGYMLGSGLANDLEGLEFCVPALSRLPDFHWLEVATTGSAGPLGPAAGMLERWRTSGGDATFTTVSAPPFWATIEVAIAEEILEATVESLEKYR